MSATVSSRPLRPRQAARQAKAGVRGGWLRWLVVMLHAIETRRRLAEMDDRMLRDIGVSRSEALEEAARAPWDITHRPRHAPWLMR
jgi:uncharacterized protein YjiS (DUF1127 family)